jgi:hypothetical protein
MHLRPFAGLVLALNLLFTVDPLIVRPVAQELRQCYVEGQPCGTPQQLYERIQYCLQDPNLCRDVRITRVGDDPGTAPADPGSAPSSPKRATTSLPTKQVIHSRPAGPQPRANVPADSPSAVEASATEPPGGSIDVVTRAVGELPLDPAIKALNGTMPNDAAAVERRLGLRRTRVPGIDMRQRTPTPAEIVDALEPVKDPHR